MRVRCKYDGRDLAEGEPCPECKMYNAAVAAQEAAALRIAKDFDPTTVRAWLNTHGVFADTSTVTKQVGTPEQAAPFLMLTGHARLVQTFQPVEPKPKRGRRERAKR